MGPRRPALRHPRHLVPDRRRSLHRLHLHRRSGARVRRRRDRLLRRAVHDHDLSDPVPGLSRGCGRLPQARLHHRGRFRARPLRQSLAGAGGGHHRHRRDHAVYRAAAGRHAGGDRRDGRRGHRLCGRPAADHRLRHPGGLHLFERPARAGVDRHRQGYADLHHGVRRDHRRADPARRLRQDLRGGAAGEAAAGAPRAPTRPAPTAPTRRWRSARRWRCSSIRTRSPAS